MKKLFESKEYDKAQLDLAKKRLKFWESLCALLEKAIENGRCDECNEPLMYDEKDICEDCLCPE